MAGPNANSASMALESMLLTCVMLLLLIFIIQRNINMTNDGTTRVEEDEG